MLTREYSGIMHSLPSEIVLDVTMESLNKGHFGTVFLSLVRRSSSLGGPKCIGTIGRKYFGTSSCVLCREIALILERPLSEIPLCFKIGINNMLRNS